MTESVEKQAADYPELRQFLLGIAEGMTAASESVDTIYAQLERTARAYGLTDTEFMVLPTAILAQTNGPSGGRVGIRSRDIGSFHFDQIAVLYTLLNEAERGAVDPADGIRRLAEIRRLKPRFGWPVRTLGHAVLAMGLSLLLIPTVDGAILAFALGLVIGFAKLVRSPSLQLILPTVSAFVCSVVVFELAQHLSLGDPLRLLIAPLAIYLPGAALTSATVELASGQMIAGASRLVSGLVQLGLLVFGILAAGVVVGVGEADYAAIERFYVFPWWVAAVGVTLYAIGIYFHMSIPARNFGWVLVVLFVAFAAQSWGAALAGPSLSGFIGAAVMTPVVLWIATLPNGASTQITFLPAFWLLVPGASGLIGLAEAATGDAGLRDFGTALGTVLSIALGVLVGTALFQFVATSLMEFVARRRDKAGHEAAKTGGPG